MTKRGKILRDTNGGPGLLTVEGKQLVFTLENMWTSDIPPRAGMTVEVFFGSDGLPVTVRAIPESQIAREQAEETLAGVKKRGQELTRETFRRFGVGTVVGVLGLLAGWFLLTTVSIKDGPPELNFTFWNLLGFVNNGQALAGMGFGGAAGTPSGGVWDLLLLAALAGPLISFFWPDRRAHLAGLLPAVLMVLAFAVLRSHVISSVATANIYLGNRAGSEILHVFLQHVTFGLGLYVAVLSSLYFAVIGAKRFLSASAVTLEGSLRDKDKVPTY